MNRREVLGIGAATLAGVVGTTGSRSVTAETDTFEPLDSIQLPGAKELVVEDEIAYVATTDGFAVVDATDPTDLTVIAERSGILEQLSEGPLEGIQEGKIDGDHYAIGGPANPLDEERLQAVVVYDVSEPADPQRVLAVRTPFHNHNLDIDDGTLFLCGNDGARNPLVCVDITTGEELGRWSVVDVESAWADVAHPLRTIHDVWVDDGIAYCAYWNAGTWLVDVTDPSEPEAIVGLRGLDPEEQAEVENIRRGVRTLPGNDHFAMGRRGVDRDPGELPDLVGINEEAWGRMVDSPAESLGGVELWTPDGERLARIDAPPTDNATRRGTWTTAHNFDLVGDRLYTAWYRGGVRVHDISDPTDPREIGRWRNDETTSFWTAQLGRSGESILASSRRDPSAEDPEANATIYAFPDPPSSAATVTPHTPIENTSASTQTPPTLTSPTPTTPDDPTPTSGSPTPTSGSPTPTNGSPTPTSGSPTPIPDDPTPTSGDPTPTSGDGGGFGLVAGAAGLGLAALVRRLL